MYIYTYTYIDMYIIHIHIHIIIDSEIVDRKNLINQEYNVTLRDEYIFKKVPPLCFDCVKDTCKILLNGHVRVCFFVCVYVEIKPEKLYFAYCVGTEVTPLGVITHGQKHKPRA